MTNVQPSIRTRKTRPERTPDGVDQVPRAGTYGEQYVQTMDHLTLAREGSFFMFRNPTPGTGVAGHAAPTDFTARTKAFVYIRNDSTAAEARELTLHWMKLQVTAAGGATPTDWGYSMEIEPSGTSRYTSGGVAMTAQNVNGNSTATMSYTAYYGPIVAPSPGTNARLLSHGMIRPVIPVIGDVVQFDFSGSRLQPTLATAGTAILVTTIPVAPVILGPGDTFLFHELSTGQSTTGKSFHMEIGVSYR